jgi:hypothetical protein
MSESKLARRKTKAGRKGTLRKLLFIDLGIRERCEHPQEQPESRFDSFYAPAPLPPVEIDPVLVEILFGSTHRERGAQGASQPPIPTGAHPHAALAAILAMDGPFTGVVAHIALNGIPGQEELEPLLSEFLSTLLEEGDFGCQLAADEILVVCPGLSGTEARQRLESLSERLWSFQLSFIDSASILFSWGAVEASNERLLDAVTNATERMLQTKYHRKTVSIVAVPQQKRAV